MLATAFYRGCAVAIVFSHVGGALSWELKDTIESWRSKIPILETLEFWCPKPFAQNGQNVVVQQITMITVTSTEVIEAYPKITLSPIMRRKLGSDKWDSIHEGMQAQKRDGEICSTGFQLCPQSLNGGCCPNDRVCGASSCLVASTTTAAALGCGGKADLFACSLDDGGGCCPNNYKCQRDGCSPLPGVVGTQTCGSNSYLCPASMNYGCCKLGMGCGYSDCYSTDIKSFTLTQVITTTDANDNKQTFTTTITSATTPSIPLPPTTVDSGVVPKVSAAQAAVPKTSATQDNPSTPSSGLTKVQLGGIIGGAVALLLAVLIATWFIIRRLNKAIKVSDANSRKESASGPSRPSRPRPSQTDVDAMSVDPLMMSPSEIQFPSAASTPFEADSSPVFRSPFTPRSPPHTTYQRGYNAVSSSDVASTPGWNRSGSLDSTPQMSQVQNQPGSYFDIPPKDPNSNRNSQHSRNWSVASDMSQGSNIVELDAGADSDRRSSLQRALQGVNRMVNKRRGDSPNKVPAPSKTPPQQQQIQLTGGPSRPDWQPPSNNGGTLGHTLGHIPEAGESKIGVDLPMVPLPGLSHIGYAMHGDRG